MRRIKVLVQNFISEYHLKGKAVSIESITAILRDRKFDIYTYSLADCADVTIDLLEHLNVYEYANSVKCFTYVDAKHKIVFINDDLTSDEQLFLLTREAAHIYLHYSDQKSGIISKTDATKEKEANVFASLLLSNLTPLERKFQRLNISFSILTGGIVCLLLLRLIQPHMQPTSQTELPSNAQIQQTMNTDSAKPDIIPNPQHTYYWTKAGTVYHIYNDCQHLKNSNEIYSGNVDEAEKSRCCETCHIRFLLENAND